MVDNCTISREYWSPRYCADEGKWDDTTGASCLCDSSCCYHKDYDEYTEAYRRKKQCT